LIRHVKSSAVIPANAGIQWRAKRAGIGFCWIPAFAGMTKWRVSHMVTNYENFNNNRNE
jgi:hypothetical protein